MLPAGESPATSTENTGVAELVDAKAGELKKSQPFNSAIGREANWNPFAGSNPAPGAIKTNQKEPNK